MAAAFENALEHAAKPWNRTRAMNVFRDVTDLVPTDDLGTVLNRTIDSSQYFVFFARTESAASEWCGKEVQHWLDTHPTVSPDTYSTDRVLLVLTEGQDWTKVVPEALRQAYGDRDPLWVGLADVHDHPSFLKVGAGNESFDQAVMKAGAFLRGYGVRNEDLQRFRDECSAEVKKAKRVRRLAETALAVLTVISVVAALLAVKAEATARKQLATANGLLVASTAQSLLSDRLDQSLLLALSINRSGGTPQARSSMTLALQAARTSGLESMLHTGSAAGVGDIAFSADGQRVVVGGLDGGVQLWDVATRKVVGKRLATDGAEPVVSVAISKDGNIVAVGGRRGMVRVWDLRTRSLRGSISMSKVDAVRVAISPDGTRVATAVTQGSAQLWKVGNRGLTSIGKPLADEYCEATNAVAFSSDGRRLATACKEESEARVGLWNGDTGLPLPDNNPFLYEGAIVTSVAFRPDGRLLATGSQAGELQLWDTEARTPKGPVREPYGVNGPLALLNGTIVSVAFSPDGGALATASNLRSAAGTVTVFDLVDNTARNVTKRKGAISAVAFGTVHSLASAGDDGTVQFWNLGQPARTPLGVPVVTDTPGDNNDPQVAISPDWKSAVIGYGSGGLVHVDLDTNASVTLVAESGGPIATAVSNGAMCRRSAQEKSCAGITRVAFSPDGRTFANGDKFGRVQLWDGTEHPCGDRQTCPADLQDANPCRRVGSLAFDPDGTVLAVGCDDGSVRFWDVRARTRIGLVPSHTSGVRTIAYSPDGRWMATGGEEGTVRLWDAASRTPQGLALTDEKCGSVTALAFDSSGVLVAGCGEGAVLVWDVRSHRLLRNLIPSGSGSVSSIAISPNANTVGVGRDREMVLLDMGTGKPLGKPLAAESGTVTNVVFSGDGLKMATSDAKYVRLWKGILWTDDSLERQVCGFVGGNLSADEWKQLVPPGFRQRARCPD